MWGRVDNRKELLCQYLRTGQLFKSGPATSPEYVWHSELKEVDGTELQFSGGFFSVWIWDFKKIKLFTMWDLNIIMSGTNN